MGPGGTAVPCAVVEYSPEERVLNSECRDVQRCAYRSKVEL